MSNLWVKKYIYHIIPEKSAVLVTVKTNHQCRINILYLKLKKAEPYITKDDKKILLVTWKGMKEKLLSIMQERFPDKTFDIIHFFGPRGVNIYKDFDSCFVFGTPNVNPSGVYDFATFLFSYINDQEQYILKQGTNDLYQMVHRIRPVLSEKKIIILGKNWANIGEPDVTVEVYGRKDKAKERLLPFLKENGFVDKDICSVHGIYCALTDEEKEEWDRVREDKELPGTSYDKIEFKDKNAYREILNILHEETNEIYYQYKLEGERTIRSGIGCAEKRLAFYGCAV